MTSSRPLLILFLVVLLSCSSDDNDIMETPTSAIIVEPNPVISDMTVSFELFQPSAVKVSIIDLHGAPMEMIERMDPVPAGWHHFYFNVSSYRQGLFFVQAMTEKDTLVSRFIKQDR